jgi:hypothetical protein
VGNWGVEDLDRARAMRWSLGRLVEARAMRLSFGCPRIFPEYYRTSFVFVDIDIHALPFVINQASSKHAKQLRGFLAFSRLAIFRSLSNFPVALHSPR